VTFEIGGVDAPEFTVAIFADGAAAAADGIFNFVVVVGLLVVQVLVVNPT